MNNNRNKQQHPSVITIAFLSLLFISSNAAAAGRRPLQKLFFGLTRPALATGTGLVIAIGAKQFLFPRQPQSAVPAVSMRPPAPASAVRPTDITSRLKNR